MERLGTEQPCFGEHCSPKCRDANGGDVKSWRTTQIWEDYAVAIYLYIGGLQTGLFLLVKATGLEEGKL